MQLAQYPPGQQLPGTVYRVVRHLATGGMGSVYDVEDVTVGKRYVLKTLHPQLVARQDLARRMEAEARALAKLQHPNIVDVVTAGVTTDEQRMPFYVMERLVGQNLRVVIEKKGSLELSHCFRIAIDVLDALEHAHENAVIHRDVKPENIFLHRNVNGTTITKLLDFGIMRLLDRKMSHTQGKFIGTLRYASPEQIFGGELGPATDIYSLGIVLYETLCGRGPFDDVGDAYAIGAAHAQMPPPPLSRFVAVPAELERLVMGALSKSPQDRPTDCFAFARELRRMLRQEDASPRSATAINVLSSVPSTRAVAALAGTELSPVPAAPAPSAATEEGMRAPSLGGASSGPAAAGAGEGGVFAETVRQETGDARTETVPFGTPPPPGAAAAGPAVTLASEAARAGAPPLVDRAAETHASDAGRFTQRLALNGTSVDDGAAPLFPEDAVRAALAEREPLEVPPASGDRQDGRSGELVFPRGHGMVGVTGPLAGEARTRPPERGMLLPLLGAAAFGALLVGGAVLLVIRPWVRYAAHGAPPAAPAIATVSAAPPAAGPASDSPSLASSEAARPPAVTSAAPSVTVEPAASAAPAAASGRATVPARTTSAPHAPVVAPSPARKSAPGRAAGAPRPEDVGFD